MIGMVLLWLRMLSDSGSQSVLDSLLTENHARVEPHESDTASVVVS
jgi:hypothetical protein